VLEPERYVANTRVGHNQVNAQKEDSTMLSWLVAQIHAAKMNSTDEDVRRTAAERLYQLMVRGNPIAARILLNRMWDFSLPLFVQWGLWKSGTNIQEMVQFYTLDLSRPKSLSEFEELKPRFRYFPESQRHIYTESPEMMNLTLRTHAGSALCMIGAPSIVPLRDALDRSVFSGLHKHKAESMAAEILHALDGLTPSLRSKHLPNGPQVNFHPELFR
jgi:hypothetical protein